METAKKLSRLDVNRDSRRLRRDKNEQCGAGQVWAVEGRVELAWEEVAQMHGTDMVE